MVIVSIPLQSNAGLMGLAPRSAGTCGIGYLYLRTGFRKRRFKTQRGRAGAIPPALLRAVGLSLV
jgi:hypothetical protein